MAKRLQAMGQPNYRDGFRVALHPAVLDAPLNWSRSQLVFVNSMSDLFHEDVPLDFIRKVFNVMARARQHSFQVLTKRSERLEALAKRLPWPSNVWIGVSVESADYAYRIEHLRHVPASTRFASFEPLLADVGELVSRPPSVYTDMAWSGMLCHGTQSSGCDVESRRAEDPGDVGGIAH
jgi:protein gp37